MKAGGYRVMSFAVLLYVSIAACGDSADPMSVETETGSDAAGDSNSNSNTNEPPQSPGDQIADPGGSLALAAWIVNTTERSTEIFESDSNQGVLFDVQLAEASTVDSVEYMLVQTSGIPQYDVLATEELIDELNARPRASSDFAAGETTALPGDVIVFGEDIGFNTRDQNCGDTGGLGYWPPGPGCPVDLGRTEFFPAEPEPEPIENVCETGLGTVGLMVNGTAIFNWGDGMSFGDGIWFNLAPIAEQYDVDICGGHAANGEYHHHFYTTCLAELVGDDGSDHSPIYGFAADGYPLYGPYESAGALAKSGWEVREYGADPALGGCGTPGERTCTLVDEYDLTQGVDTSVQAGPNIGAVVTTLSGNSLAADAGYYYEDYYYAGHPTDGAQLDEHNGHDHGDERGYHYHITLTEEDGELSPVFPFTVGPRFRGTLPDNAVASCGGAGGLRPPGGGAP